MSRSFLKKLINTAVPDVFNATVTSAIGGSRYRVAAVDGTAITATGQGNIYARGDKVRLRGTEIIGRIKSTAKIRKYEV